MILAAHFVDDHGNERPLKIQPEWSSSDENIVACTATSDPMMCDIRPKGGLGTATVFVRAVGEQNIEGAFDVTVLGTLATKVGVTMSVVEPWPV